MSARIRMLDDALVNQIAAGEVVERPSSVVKELLDNAVDAAARSITVEIERGGINLVRVTDDGEGMVAGDAVLALRRHATSKISSAADLAAITTMGFRGEALPSIASVSRLSLTTRTRDAMSGARVAVEGAGELRACEVGCAPGTTVEVRDLFWNVPARRKFLKATATESAHVGDMCLRTALARPELKLVLVRDGKRAREYLPASSFPERVRSALVDDELTLVEGERARVRITALLSAPERARSGAAGLYVFVNGRPVRERTLARAAACAYGSVLGPGRYPSGVLDIGIDPREVDVNVHPQKTEVRFARSGEVLDAITRVLAKGLGTSAWSGPSARGNAFWSERLGGAMPAASPASPATRAVPPVPYVIGGSDTAAVAASPSPLLDYGGTDTQRGRFGSLRVLGQTRRMLIVCEGRDALHVIDQHAADERVRYHRLRTAYGARAVPAQRLLFPERVECAAAEVSLVEERGAELLSVGLDCTPLGPTTVAVHAVPALASRACPSRLLMDVLDEFAHLGSRAFGDAIDKALATMACHGAIRAGDELSITECAALLASLDEAGEFAGHCPHGRPIVYSVGLDEIERRVGR